MPLANPIKQAPNNNDIDIEEAVLFCANCALDKKAIDLLISYIGSISSFADYFVICTGSSDRHVAAIADSVQKGMKERGVLPLGIAGKGANTWRLIDYGDLIIHVFLESARLLYDLEGLWCEAPTMRVADGIYNISKISLTNHRGAGRNA